MRTVINTKVVKNLKSHLTNINDMTILKFNISKYNQSRIACNFILILYNSLSIDIILYWIYGKE